jgi:hypothetical protein
MERLLLAVVALLIGFQFVAATPLGPGSIFPLGSTLGPFGIAYYVANGGSDSNNGLSPATAWQTIAHVNGQSLGPNATVLFSGGQTFSGGVVITTSISPSNITVGSYGAGQATISSGNSAACIMATNVPAVIIQNIICAGGGDTTNTTDGITVANSSADTLTGPTISHVTLSGYGANGINISGTDSVGFTGIVITNNTVHDVTGNGGIHTSCIGLNTPGHGTSPYSHFNITVTENTVYNCTGEASQSDWSGGGIGIYSTDGGLVAHNVAHDFSANNTHCSGAGGFVAIASNAIIFQFNEAYNGKFANGGCDGNGFDIDGGATNIVMQYNWSHDNMGDGYLLDEYVGQSAWNNNVLRFNIGQNDDSEIHVVSNPGTSMSACQVYNNTLYNSATAVIYQQSSDTGTVDCNFSNNIFYTGSNASLLVSMPNPSSMVFTGNDYFGGGTFSYNGRSYATFVLWQTASGQEKVKSVNVGRIKDPALYVPGGGSSNGGYVPANLMAYNLKPGSAMVGAGLNLSTLYGINPGTQDYYGTAVSAATLPVGAAAGHFATFAASCSQSTTFVAPARRVILPHSTRRTRPAPRAWKYRC